MHAVTVGCIGLSTAVKTAFDLACPLRAMTGWDCPLCGGTRAALALLHGRWQEAVHDNLLVVLSPVAFSAAGVVWWVSRQPAGRQHLPRIGQPAVLVAVSLILWTVLRNLPALDWLRPLDVG